ncbi:hypothetical protein D3C72_2009700 [compost metagenome]
MHGHLFVKRGPIAPVGVHDPNLCAAGGVAVQKAGQGRPGVAFVQHVTAHDEIEMALHRALLLLPRPIGLPFGLHLRVHFCLHAPLTGAVLERCHAVQAYVFLQKLPGQRMAVAGGDVDAAAVAHQAGQAQATANFQHPFTGQ